MKRLACPCPALPHFWQLGSRFMAEGTTGTQAPGQGPHASIQHLRAQYEGLRRQQRTQAHLMVLPKGGNIATPAESMISTVWINKERRSSLSQEEAASGEARMLEEADRSCLQAAESPWHTHLEMHRSVQTFHQENIHPVKPQGQFVRSDTRLPPEEDQHAFDNNQKTQRGIKIPEAAQPQCQAGSTKTKAEEAGLKTSIPCPSSIKHPHRAAKPAHYPFPQRKTPKISQAARNLGLYGPV
ncbi:PREDICTED: uncharacterized protein C9orf152 homolog [Chinchilla lanigera]|uniref:Chromosome 9 open reading frame 152 n=1 Tax=Chinchilla lanigera TaxID=34839 RepID=A0A8C2VRD4_CHILA|nr:PREDICTED: uncharacterized protein C9orf152 homolog [Chinchilla lanigera]